MRSPGSGRRPAGPPSATAPPDACWPLHGSSCSRCGACPDGSWPNTLGGVQPSGLAPNPSCCRVSLHVVHHHTPLLVEIGDEQHVGEAAQDGRVGRSEGSVGG